MKIRNITPGPKGVHTKDRGLVYVDAGAIADVDLAEGETAPEDWFEPVKDEPAKDAPVKAEPKGK
jgi:hypothetical protein